MKVLTRNIRIPSRAGKTRIHFVDPHELNNEEPHREKEDIMLPLNDDAEMQMLQKGRQFIFTTRLKRPGAFGTMEDAVFFGGTDEEPFLVRLDPRIKNYYRADEKSFFWALKPDLAKHTERIFGAGMQTVRQGDIFATPTSLSWEMLVHYGALAEDKSVREIEPSKLKGSSVFETRHLFTGEGMNVKVPSLGNPWFVEGILRAPDHADRTVKGIHVLSQTAYLYDPKNAE